MLLRKELSNLWAITFAQIYVLTFPFLAIFITSCIVWKVLIQVFLLFGIDLVYSRHFLRNMHLRLRLGHFVQFRLNIHHVGRFDLLFGFLCWGLASESVLIVNGY